MTKNRISETTRLAKLYVNLKFWFALVAIMYAVIYLLVIIILGGDAQNALGTAFTMLAYMPSVLILPIVNKFSEDTWLLWVLVVWLSEMAVIVWLKLNKKLPTRTILIAGTIILLLLVTQFVGCLALAVTF